MPPLTIGLYEFQFQTGAIKSVSSQVDSTDAFLFQFQTGSIRRLSKNYINIILDPYSSCQVNFYFNQIKGQSAVDRQSCKFSGRLTALCVVRVYRQYFAKFGKISSTKLVNFRRSTADCPDTEPFSFQVFQDILERVAIRRSLLQKIDLSIR